MSEKKKRPSPYSYRPPEARRDAFERLVAASGLSVNAFLTEAVFGRNRHRPGELKQLAAILARCGHIADALRESGQTAQTDTLLLEPLKDDLTEIRFALFLLMGRKP